MKNCILNVIASAAERTAKSSVNSASFFTMYQPKEPDALKKDGVDRKKQGNGIYESEKASKNIWNDDGDISDIHNLSKTRHSICC